MEVVLIFLMMMVLCLQYSLFEEKVGLYFEKYYYFCLIDYYNLLKKRKGVSLVCGVHGCLKNSGLLNYMKEISSELCAIRVINWNN